MQQQGISDTNTMGAKEPNPMELTNGERLVGLNFNPAGDDKVAKAKRLCAALADLLEEDFESGEKTSLKTELYLHTRGEILNAQMNVVKVLTLKY